MVNAAHNRHNDTMAVRAAWLHYAGGFTQAQVAKRLGLTSLKAHRLITSANKQGLVKVYIDGDVTECVEHENALTERFGLDYCEVVPDFDDQATPYNALGIAGGHYLKRQLENDDIDLIGVGHGRTLAACVEQLPQTTSKPTSFVSLLGGFSQRFSANPHDVIHRLAQRTGSPAYVMPVPFFANTVNDRKVLLKQRGLTEVMKLARNTSLNLVGIGSIEEDPSLVASGMLENSEMDTVLKAGGVGELLGHFYDERGQSVRTNLSDRTMGLTRVELKSSRIVAIAGGGQKIRAIKSVLNSRLLSGLITDERTARALVKHFE
ncbi:MAG: sugar-binding transcriptional regulator [Granulosicoccus sp.]